MPHNHYRLNYYKAITWFSVLVIIGEGLALSDVKFVSLEVAYTNQGEVLGAATSTQLEALGDTHYPASYLPVVEPITDSQDADSIVLEEQTSDPADTTEVEKGIVDAVLEPSAQDTILMQEEIAGETDVVSTEATEGVMEEDVSSTKQEVDEMILFLNGTLGSDEGEVKNSPVTIDRIKNLINKNKRFYLKDLKKQLEDIQEGLDEGSEL